MCLHVLVDFRLVYFISGVLAEMNVHLKETEALITSKTSIDFKNASFLSSM